MQGLLEAKALYGPKIGLVGRFLFYGYSMLDLSPLSNWLDFQGKSAHVLRFRVLTVPQYCITNVTKFGDRRNLCYYCYTIFVTQ